MNGFRRSFERGAESEELILIVGSDSEFAYSASVSSEPPEVNEILVNASFADWGQAQRDRDAVRFAIIALALTFVPALLMLLLRRKREVPNLHVAASKG